MSTLGSRAKLTLYVVGSGLLKPCGGCSEPIDVDIRYATARTPYVVCNVYEGTRWDRIEHWHAQCYRDAASPHGPITDDVMPTKRSAFRTGHLSKR